MRTTWADARRVQGRRSRDAATATACRSGRSNRGSGAQDRTVTRRTTSFLVTEGTMSFLVGETWVDAPTGTFLLVPAGVTHDFENRSDAPATAFNFFIPAASRRSSAAGSNRALKSAEGPLARALRRSSYFSYGRAERLRAPSGAGLPCAYVRGVAALPLSAARDLRRDDALLQLRVQAVEPDELRPADVRLEPLEAVGGLRVPRARPRCRSCGSGRRSSTPGCCSGAPTCAGRCTPTRCSCRRGRRTRSPSASSGR